MEPALLVGIEPLEGKLQGAELRDEDVTKGLAMFLTRSPRRTVTRDHKSEDTLRTHQKSTPRRWRAHQGEGVLCLQSG